MLVPVGSRVVEQLRVICGDENVLIRPDEMEPYAHDYTEDLLFYPEVVVRPRTAVEVSAVLALAYEAHIPVTPRGGGTGLSGGALPVQGGILLSTDRMNAILEIDMANGMGVVEPGVITQVYQEAVEALGLFYPPDPSSRGSCTLGGNVAEGAGGPRAVKYGTTRDWIYGLEVVLPDGRIMQTGGKNIKDVTGYNLTQLFVGSEGTLGIVTKIITRLMPLPKHRMMMFAPFDTMEAALEAVLAVLKDFQPSALEFMERDAIGAAVRQKGISVAHADAEAQLMLELDGNHHDKLMEELEAVGERLMAHGARDVIVATTPAQTKTLWDIRRCMGEAVKSLSTYKEEDAVVPRSQIVKLIRGVKAITEPAGIATICYGHAGDGNIHINVLRMGLDQEVWEKRLPGVIEELFRFVVSLGGTISGEHGIGYSQKAYLPIALGEAELWAMKRVKEALDPKGLLNPGKIF